MVWWFCLAHMGFVFVYFSHFLSRISFFLCFIFSCWYSRFASACLGINFLWVIRDPNTEHLICCQFYTKFTPEYWLAPKKWYWFTLQFTEYICCQFYTKFWILIYTNKLILIYTTAHWILNILSATNFVPNLHQIMIYTK